jgi:integrase
VADLITAAQGQVATLKSASDVKRQLRWWNSQIGTVRLSDLDPGDIALARDRLAAEDIGEGKRRSASTVRHYLHALSGVLQWGCEELRWLDRNPARLVRKPAPPPHRVRWLEQNEREALLAACAASKNPDLHLLVSIALCSAGRYSEIKGARWSAVDFAQRIIWLDGKDTKTAEPRGLPLTEEVVAMLKARPRPINRDAPIFSSGSVRSAWYVALKRAGLEHRQFRFHDLRHDACTRLLRVADPLTVARIAGHASLATTRRYAHVRVDAIVAAADRASGSR